jgi:hypothetical protein
LVVVPERGVVDALVVPVAQRDGIPEICPAAEAPRFSVMQLAPGEGPFAAVSRAGVVLQAQGDPLCLGEEPGFATEVEGG